MTSTTPARAERDALCDLFLEVGPDVPTLCEGWTARDLAAHLVVRERRPDIAPGMVISALAGHSEHVRVAETERPWPELVERVRTGPPVWNPMRIGKVEELVNTVEFFVHHEDVRRAQDGWTRRALSPDLEDALAAPLRRMGGVLTRRAGVGLVAEPAGRSAVRLRRGEPAVTIRGPVGELVLYVYGRKDVAAVELDGPADAVARVGAASFGF
ncbi:MAG TPA: TIGR03085 family metal-binding protein [Ilumatobacteraceae bacterium]|nr:TIGR03085 family metal-binding protein [Ilumatobacteraceae bacterium]